jgi:hypothetical protein
VSNTSLGVAVTIPPGLQEAAAEKYAPGTINLEIPAQIGHPVNGLRFRVEPEGTYPITMSEAQAVADKADALTQGLTIPVTRSSITVAGTTGILLRGMPGYGPNVQIILAHEGALYDVITWGTNLDADQ